MMGVALSGLVVLAFSDAMLVEFLENKDAIEIRGC